MASVPLTFAPPAIEDLTKLLIYESTSSSGPFTLIETVTPVGSFPDYIDNYTTDEASSVDNWFAIKWEDSQGGQSRLSAPVQGGTLLLIGMVINNVKQRDSSLSEAVVAQEAAVVIERYFGRDPYTVLLTDIPESMRYRTLAGLTYMTMARTIQSAISSQTSSATESATLGLVSMKSESGSGISSLDQSSVQALLELAAMELGIPTTIVMQMAELDVGQGSIASYDHSRLVGWIGLE